MWYHIILLFDMEVFAYRAIVEARLVECDLRPFARGDCDPRRGKKIWRNAKRPLTKFFDP